MKTLEIKLPDEIFGILSTIAKQQDKFVVDAIKEKLNAKKNIRCLSKFIKRPFRKI